MDNFFFGNKSNNNYSRTYSKGTSFKFSVWNENDTYNNDEFVVDFVQWDKSLWAAKKTSTNIIPTDGEYWELIVKGVSDIEFRQIDNRIEYRYKDPTSEWKDLFELASVSEDQIKKMLEDLDIKYGNTYDTELSETSTNAVQNQAVTKKFKQLDEKNTKTDSELVNIKSSVNTALSNSKSYTDSKISETKIQIDSELNKKVNQSDVEEIVDELNKSINLKVDKVYGKGLSTNDFNDNYKSKLDNLDSSLNSVLTSAKSHTNSEITKVDNKINSEISRAKISETNLSSRIDNLGEDVIKSLNEAKEYTDALANGEVKNNTNRINILNGIGEGSIIKTVKDEISNLVGTAPEKLDTLQEIADYLEEHEDMASGLVNSLSELETKKVDKTELNNFKTDTDSALQSLEKTKANTTGYYPSLHVGTADTAIDLAGRGESVPAEFGFRASGGKSIKDGRAYIKRIKGNSVVWNQKFRMESNKLANNGVTSTLQNDNSIQLAGQLTNAYFNIGRFSANIATHKYLFVLSGATSALNGKIFSLLNRSFDATISNGYAYIFHTNSDPSKNTYIGLKVFSTGDTINETLYVNQYDLTQMFGAGNEPTTIEEFNARVATLGVDMNAYNEGQVIHCNTESIKSVGDNAWDEEWELGDINSSGLVNNTDTIRPKNYTRIIPNEKYYFFGFYSRGIYFYDKDKNFLEIQYKNNGEVQVPANAHFLKFRFPTNYGTTYKGDYMISLVHSGWKQDTDAGYQPYWQDILPLPIISKCFPQGMKSAGTAHDEIRYNKATQKWEYSKGKIKSVDMGTLNWSYQGVTDSYPYGFFGTNIKSDLLNKKAGGEVLCPRYTKGNFKTDKTILANSANNIVYVIDYSYTDTASFKAAMAGVMLHYESNDWEWVELDTEDQNFRDYYNVADFGTEQSQSSVPSASFSADIIYQFNAVDMIREHEIEITDIKVSKQDFISDLSTIRSNAAKGATALQNVPSEYVKRSELTALQNEINALRAMIEEITTQV